MPLNEYLRKCAREKRAPAELTAEDAIALVELLDAVENVQAMFADTGHLNAAMRRIRGR